MLLCSNLLLNVVRGDTDKLITEINTYESHVTNI